MRIIINANWHPKAGVLLKVSVDPRTLPGCSDVRSRNVGRDLARAMLLPLGRGYVGCEIDQTFYNAAYSRIFDNPPPQPLEEFLPFMGNQKVD